MPAHAPHQRLDNLRFGFVEAQVVEKGKRSRSHHYDVARDGGDQVVTQFFIPTGHHRHLALGAHAVCALHHHRILQPLERIAQGEERAKRAKPGEHRRRVLLVSFGHVPLDAPHRLVSGLDVHARGLVIHL
jgi:hypothetical protein